MTTGVSKKYTAYRPIMFHVYIDKLFEYIDAHDDASEQIIEAINAATLYYIKSSSLQLYYFHPQNQDSYHETMKKIREMKNMPRYAAAIHAKESRYTSFKMRIFKHTLLLPCIWPIKVLMVLNEKAMKQ